jgi:hypothetical protein
VITSEPNKIELKIPTQLLREQKLFVATPMYGGQCAGAYTRSMIDLGIICKQIGIELNIHYLFNESLITRARNYCCDEFMRSGFTHMMFIDSDIHFNPQDILALLGISSQPDNPYDVIGGPYPKKCISWEKVKTAVNKGFADEDPNRLERVVGDYVFNPVHGNSFPLNAPVEVLEIGTGFMMIRRKAFELYQQAYPHFMYRPDHIRTEHFDGSREIMTYFDCVIDRGYDFGDLKSLLVDFGDGKVDADFVKKRAAELWEIESKSSKRYLSEDYMFCQYLRKAGAKIWLCPWMQLKHVGSYIFGGSLIDLAAIGAAATADAGELNAIRDRKKAKQQQLPALPAPQAALPAPSFSSAATPPADATPRKRRRRR